MHVNGEGVQMNKEEASKNYKKVADKGNKDAMLKYGLILENGIGVEVDKGKALSYYKKAKKKIIIVHLKCLKILYENISLLKKL